MFNECEHLSCKFILMVTIWHVLASNYQYRYVPVTALPCAKFSRGGSQLAQESNVGAVRNLLLVHIDFNILSQNPE